MMSSSSLNPEQPPADAVYFGDTIQLLTRSSYSKEYSTSQANAADVLNRPLEPVGFYEKNGRYGTLVAVPPIGAGGSPHFRPSTFTITATVDVDDEVLTRQKMSELPLKYGDIFVLVDDQGLVWNNHLTFAAAYIGPRPRGFTGEMTVSVSHASKRSGEPVLYGDAFSIDVQESHRWRQGVSKRITNFKKSSSKLVGGYLVADGTGLPITFVPKFISGRGMHAQEDEAAAAVATPARRPAGGLAASGVSSAVATPARQALSPPSSARLAASGGVAAGATGASATGSNGPASARLPARQMSVNVDEHDVALSAVVVHWADGGEDTLPADWGQTVTLGEVSMEDSVTVSVRAGDKAIEHKLNCPPPKIDTEDDDPTDTTIRSVVNLAKYGVQNLQLEVVWGSVGAPKTVRRLLKSTTSLSRLSMRSIRSRSSSRSSRRRVKKAVPEEGAEAKDAAAAGGAAGAPATPTTTAADYEKRFTFALALFAITGVCAGLQFKWTNSLPIAAATAAFGMLSALLIVLFAPFKKASAGGAAEPRVTVAVEEESEEEEEYEEVRITRTLQLRLLADKVPVGAASTTTNANGATLSRSTAARTPSAVARIASAGKGGETEDAEEEGEEFSNCTSDMVVPSAPLAAQAAATNPALKGSTSSLSSADIAAGKGEFPPMPEKWLRAEKGNREKAEHRYKVTMKWRKENGIDKLLDEPQPYWHLIKKAYPHFMQYTDKEGHQLWYEAAAKTNQKLLHVAGVTQDMLLRHYLFCTEFLWTLVDSDENAQSFTVLNMDGLTMASTQGETMAYVKKAAKTLGDHYPERCNKTFIINAPWWFNTIFKIVSLVLDPVTKKKISVYPSGSKGIEKLAELVDAKYIPEEIGGKGLAFGSSPQEKLMREHVEAVLKKHGMKPLGLDVTVD